jgi:rhodanese-related sulfurtransferase
MESLHFVQHSLVDPKTPNFIKSLFDEDSGLGMDFDDVHNSPMCLFEMSKSKRQEVVDTPSTSYSKKKCIKLKHKNLFKKSLLFDAKILSTNDSQDSTLSETEDISVEGSVLTGDGIKECCLPTVQGRFHDLRYITPSTMTDVINGTFDDVIGNYRIIDSRYSYEYDGGHIQGAENVHNKDDILEFFNNHVSESDGKRHIIIFHCEFSSERGPKMCRFLRNQDREINAENYPALCYPETYILKGGYKEFYESHKTFCTPMNYVPMLSKDHKDDLRHFRSKSKSWYAGQKRIKSGSRLFC